MRGYQLFLWESTEWFPQKNTVTLKKKQKKKQRGTVLPCYIAVHVSLPQYIVDFSVWGEAKIERSRDILA